ncbi:MAG TPA: response regulator [Anaeromyxobacteraceae bacterium]|nr:response regulator [Anaeromyxobacteraceae bacterium]
MVEDDREMLRGLRLLLSESGYEVTATDGVRAALAALRASPPDLALLDHALKDGTAFDLLGAFAEIDAGVPSVVLTGTAEADLEQRLLAKGARAFLAKPVNPGALLAALAGALTARPAR